MSQSPVLSMPVLVLGNAAFDESFAVGEWPRAGASILGRAMAAGLGGKGLNQAVVLGRAGVDTRLVAGIGDDARGAAIREGLAGEALDFAPLVMAGRATDLSIVLTVPGGENCIVTTSDCAGSVGVAEVERALRGFGPGDTLVLQGNLGAASTEAALRGGRALGMRVVVNPSPLRDWQAGMLGLVDLLVLNRGEALALAGEAAPAPFHAAGVRELVLTLGAEGALLSGPGGVTSVAAAPARVVDTTGAGDTFLGAMLASALLRGAGLDAEALRVGARAAALTVGRPGAFAALPGREELAAILGG